MLSKIYRNHWPQPLKALFMSIIMISQLEDYKLIQYQILQTDIIRIV